MPGKNQTYPWTKFPAEAIREASGRFMSHLDNTASSFLHVDRSVTTTANETWNLDTDDEFYAEYRREIQRALFGIGTGSAQCRLSLAFEYPHSVVSVQLPTRGQVISVFEVLEANHHRSQIEPKPAVFIGHGQSEEWRLLSEYLRTNHGLAVDAFELKPRAGFTAKEVLERIATETSFALLIHTAEDEQADGAMRARQNVVHETGLFQGRLGFARAIIVREDGCEDFSNLDGVQEIRFGKGNIREAFGEVIGTIRREFPGA